MTNEELKQALKIAKEQLSYHELMAHEYYINQKTMLQEKKKRRKNI